MFQTARWMSKFSLCLRGGHCGLTVHVTNDLPVLPLPTASGRDGRLSGWTLSGLTGTLTGRLTWRHFPLASWRSTGGSPPHPLPGSPSHILLRTEVVGLGWVGAEGEGSHEATVSKSHGQLPVQPRRPLGCLVSLLGR